MNKGGRKKDPIWVKFQEIEENGKVVKAKCKACGHMQSIKACRMRAHVKLCEQRISNSANNAADKVVLHEEENQLDLNPTNTSSVIEVENISKRRKIQSSIDAFYCSTNDSEKKELDKLIGMFFYACNVPFSHVESEHFKRLISKLRPGYKPPTRKALAGNILDDIHDELQNQMIKNLKGKPTTLIVDGWSNVHNEPLTVAALYAEGKSYLVDAIDTGSDHKTAEYLIDLSKHIISTASDKYGCQVKSVVTDNANCMVKMRKELEKAEELNLISHGCSAHYLNLLGQDITPQNIISHVIKVQKYFRNHHAPGAWLRKCVGAIKPQLPCETRWNSQLKCLQSFLTNHAAYLSIVNEHLDDIDRVVTDLIRNFNLHKQVKDLVKQLQPISIALDQLQKDTANIADATHEWLALLQNDILKPHAQAVMNRFNQAILPHHMFAYLMHPTYKGERLSNEQKETARKWIEEKNSDLLPAVIFFETESGPYPMTYFNDSIRKRLDPVTWWKGVHKCSDIPDELYGYVEMLLSSPSSSAGLERIFSSFAFIHSKLRNRLRHPTAKKLLFCYTMLHCSKENEDCDIF